MASYHHNIILVVHCAVINSRNRIRHWGVRGRGTGRHSRIDLGWGHGGRRALWLSFSYISRMGIAATNELKLPCRVFAMDANTDLSPLTTANETANRRWCTLESGSVRECIDGRTRRRRHRGELSRGFRSSAARNKRYAIVILSAEQHRHLPNQTASSSLLAPCPWR